MIGFSNLAGAPPCAECGSDAGDCDWLHEAGRCTVSCPWCAGANVARCGYCDEIVPCGMQAGRNPRPDSICAWRALSQLHAPDCDWAASSGGAVIPLPPRVRPVGPRAR